VDNSVVFVRLASEKSTRWLTVRAPDGTLRDVFECMPNEVIRNPVWLPNNRGVVFSRLRAVPERPGATVSTLWRLDFDTGVARAIDIALENPRDPAVSPDGRHLAFTSGRPTREPWVLENLQLGRPRR
jgi:Tol biopolymer transport system component